LRSHLCTGLLRVDGFSRPARHVLVDAVFEIRRAVFVPVESPYIRVVLCEEQFRRAVTVEPAPAISLMIDLNDLRARPRRFALAFRFWPRTLDAPQSRPLRVSVPRPNVAVPKRRQ